MQIRDVTAADVPAMAALADAKRTEYAAYSPIFWRKSDTGVEVQTRFFTNRMLPPILLQCSALPSYSY